MLDLNKVLMQDFHPNYIKNKHVDKAEMLLTDTDSLIWLKILMKTSTKIKSYDFIK